MFLSTVDLNLIIMINPSCFYVIGIIINKSTTLVLVIAAKLVK